MLFATVAAMRHIEEIEHIRNDIDYYQMMRDASNRATELLCERFAFVGKRVTVLCGRGNNGGDGLVVATRLHEAGAVVTVVLVKGGPACEPATSALRDMPPEVRMVTLPSKNLSGLFVTDFIIDAIYGIGFTGEVADEDEPVFALARQSEAVRIALDLPSGVDGDSGRYTDCIEADITIAMSVYKPAHLVSWCGDCCGELLLADTHLTRTAQDSGMLLHTLEAGLCELPERKSWSHKGDNGRLAVVCGSNSYVGAAVLACQGALRSGVGYVHLLSTEAVCRTVANYYPEVIYTVLPETDHGTIDSAASETILATVNRCSAALVGSGLGDNDHTHAVVRLLLDKSIRPLLLDADGINALRGDVSLLMSAGCSVVLTPHPGEFSRLAEAHIMDTKGDMTLAAARLSANTGAVLLLKGPVTGIFRGMQQPIFSFMGNDGLARGGSGDLLSGIIASLIAQGAPVGDAVLCGAWLHGRAAELAYSELNRRFMLPSDLPGYLSLALDELEEIERC